MKEKERYFTISSEWVICEYRHLKEDKFVFQGNKHPKRKNIVQAICDKYGYKDTAGVSVLGMTEFKNKEDFDEYFSE